MFICWVSIESKGQTVSAPRTRELRDTKQEYEVRLCRMYKTAEEGGKGRKICHHYLVGNVTKQLSLNALTCFTDVMMQITVMENVCIT